jgi:hypothetical protein
VERIKNSEQVSKTTGMQAEKVILVHGTFASSSEDHGTGWWQVGSPAYRELEKRLPPGVSLASPGELFRWSGDNTERARSKAAVQLLEHLQALEESGRPYHLIGHSHGGSVIWSALRLATARKQELRHLKSWSTVGTPFLHHQSRSPWSVRNVACMIMALLMLRPAALCLLGLLQMPYKAMTGQMEDGFVVRPAEEVGFVSAMVRAPVLKGLELLGMRFTETEGGTRLGDFDPGSGESVAHFMFCTVDGWLILFAIALLGYFTLLLASFFLSSVSEVLRISWEKRLEHRAFATYRSRWLGIWTLDDEAINGLRATMKLSVSFIGTLAVRERVFVSDLFSIPSRPIYQLIAPIYNRFFRPLLDSKIREIVVKTAQGNDRPAAQVIAVSPHPVLPPPTPSAPPLPESLQASIRQEADKHANDLGPKLRVLLSQPSLSTGFEAFAQDLSGRELVHTSYFDHAAVIDLLGLNISWCRGRNSLRRAGASREINAWFHEFKRLQVSPDSAFVDSEEMDSEEIHALPSHADDSARANSKAA